MLFYSVGILHRSRFCLTITKKSLSFCDKCKSFAWCDGQVQSNVQAAKEALGIEQSTTTQEEDRVLQEVEKMLKPIKNLTWPSGREENNKEWGHTNTQIQHEASDCSENSNLDVALMRLTWRQVRQMLRLLQWVWNSWSWPANLCTQNWLNAQLQ